MTIARVVIAIGFVVLLGIPLLFRGDARDVPDGARIVIVISPHNEQIRREFGEGFARWHQARYGEPAVVQWNTPGGTSEIRKMLLAQYEAALETYGDLSKYTSTVDVFFGGGSFEFSQLMKPDAVKATVRRGDAKPIEKTSPVLAPVEFDRDWLESVYGENLVGSDLLYDEDRYWFGVALSGFGIVYNRDVLGRLGVDEPVQWTDLCDPRLQGWIGLGSPAFSGSIKKSFDTVLQRYGWERGWQVIRRIGANSRYFALSSLKVPVDVGSGDAAAGVCIDFYGRFEAQAIADAGDPERLGYVDPPGLSAIDPDPVAMLQSAPHPIMARRFIEFCLSREAQSLWQFRVDEPGFDDDLGPRYFELRRMPILRSMYAGDDFARFVDPVNPFELARPFDQFNGDYWSFIDPLFLAMIVDNHHGLRDAWAAITSHPAYESEMDRLRKQRRAGAFLLLTADDVVNPQLRHMLRLFDAMPAARNARGEELPLIESSHLADIKAGWKTPELWEVHADPRHVTRLAFTRFFTDQYVQVLEVAEGQ